VTNNNDARWKIEIKLKNTIQYNTSVSIANLSYFSPIHFASFSIRLFRMLVEDIHILNLYKIHEKTCLCVTHGKGILLFMKLCKAFLSPSLKWLMKARKKRENMKHIEVTRKRL
jgi:hypothetical protein